MRITKWLPCLTTLCLSTCMMTGQKNDGFCDLAHPIYLDKQDKIAPETQRTILSHDETGAYLCGWDKI